MADQEHKKFRKCALCMRFIDLDDLRVHYNQHRVRIPMNEVFENEKYCECVMCGLMLSVRDISNHLKAEHPLSNKRKRIVYDLDTDVFSPEVSDNKADVKNVSAQELHDAMYPLLLSLRGMYVVL